MNTNAHRAPHRLVVAVMTITLSILLVGCTQGTLPAEKLNTVYACSQQYEVKGNFSLSFIAEQTLPAEAQRGWTDRSKGEWERMTLDRTGDVRYFFSKGDKIFIPAKCPKGAEPGEVTPTQ